MIDTIKLLIPIENREFLEKIKGKLTRTRRENLKTSELKFEYFTGEVVVGSYERTVNIYLTEGEPRGFFVEFSLPKQYLSIIYTGIGLALLLSSIRYFRMFFKSGLV